MKRTDSQNAAEIWADISGYEGRYQVSALGRVKSLARTRRCRTHNSRGVFYFEIKTRILRPQVGGTGYTKVCLHKDGVQKNFNIHRLVAEAFIPNPDGLPQVNHIDGDKRNSNVGNLEWCTAGQNLKHAYDVLGFVSHFKGKTGGDHSTSKLVIQKRIDGSIVREWECGIDAARNGFDSGSISKCCNGKSKTHKGFVWEFAGNE